MKKNKIAQSLIAILILPVLFVGFGLFCSNVYASDSSSIIKKWAWANYYECLNNSGWAATVNVSGNSKVINTLYKNASGTVNLPSYKYGHSASDSISCSKAIEGGSGWSGNLQGQSNITFSNPNGAETLLKNLGYKEDSEGQEVNFTIQAKTHNKFTMYTLLGPQTTESDGESSSVVISVKPNAEGGKTYSYKDKIGNFFADQNIELANGKLTLKISSHFLAGCTAPDGQSETFTVLEDPYEFRDNVNSVMANRTWSMTCTNASEYSSSISTTTYNFITGEVVNMGTAGKYAYQYLDDRFTGANEAAKKYAGGDMPSLVPTNTERYNMYLYYLQKVLPAGVQNRLTSEPTSTDNLTKVRLKHKDGEFKDFYANFNGTSPSSYTVYDLQRYTHGGTYFPKVVAVTMEDIISWLNSVDTSTLGDVDLTDDETGIDPKPNPDPTDPKDNPTDTDEREEKCYSEAKSLGWVICPMIFGMEEVASNIYGQIEPMIRVDKTIVSQMGDTSSSIYQAWSTFRGFANVIFVILFLLIIFSQLTGFGIDNYGIKKMLPKIIMTAILVNLSFWICAIAIDISNVVGSGIRSLLESLKVSSLGTGSVSAFQKGVATVVDFFLVAGTATGVGALAFALEGWAIVIPILLFLLVAIIAVIFAFIVLGMRQAAVILCVVFAPLAFACSMLPNTEKIFKRWWDIFKGVLLVYPIIGGLIGAGYFASAVILTDEHDFLMTIISCLLCVIPYFMIPSLLKKSLAAAGNIGEKISGFGRGLGNKARNGINGTQAVKNAKADSTAQRAQARAARYMKSDRARQVEEDIKNGRKVSMRRANKYARNASLANANRQSMINARSAQSQYNRLNSDTGFNAAMAAANAAEFDTEVGNYEKLISAGGYRPFDATDPDAKIDQNDNNALQRELEHELSQRGKENVNGAKIRALQNQLARNGKEGRNAMFNAMANAQTAAGAAGVDKEAVKAFSSNILNNHAGTMKDKHRSLYEFAKNTAVNGVSDDGVNNISQYASRGIGSINASDMTNMDLQQLQRYHKSAKGDDAKVLAQLAQSALTNEHLSQDLSEKTYNELASIARDGGYTPPERLTSKKEGDTGRLHDTTSASTSASPSASAASSASSSSRASTSSAPVRVDQATQSGAQQISATQAAAQVQNAVKQNRSAASTDRKVQSAEADALRIINSGAADATPINQIISGKTGQPVHSEPGAPKDNNSDSSTIIIGNNKPGNPSDIITPGNNKA